MKTIREVMDMPVTNLELSVRCCNCLKNVFFYDRPRLASMGLDE